MRFYGLASDKDVIDYLFERISERLRRGDKVLWLLSGGSAIRIETAIAAKLALLNHAKLTVSLFDERYGQPGHADSNWRQLQDAGFKLPQAKLQPVLTGEDMATTVKGFSSFIGKSLDDADFTLGLAGIGPDGHTLGIKPRSPALDTKDLVSGYDWDDYRRITTTEAVIARLDEIVVYAFGPEKKEQLETLKRKAGSADQPAQLLKLCRNVRIYSDQLL
ncbi:MAG TPA: 6-phosphogluconolactonase [Candidatus Saccharimonadales bacterium]|nr:6-phosphogluconolactonase [Candidatus Saccharimonadales bacterium]